MHTVEISDEVKNILDRLVADRVAPSGAAFIEQVVRGWAEQAGAFWDALSDEVRDLAATMRAGRTTCSIVRNQACQALDQRA